MWHRLLSPHARFVLSARRRPMRAAALGAILVGPSLLSRSGCGFAWWHNPEHEARNLFPGFERTENLVADRLQTLQESHDCLGVLRRELRKSVPRHDRRQEAAVWPLSGLYRRRDLLRGPTTDTGLFVRCDVGGDEDTLARNFEAHIR